MYLVLNSNHNINNSTGTITITSSSCPPAEPFALAAPFDSQTPCHSLPFAATHALSS